MCFCKCYHATYMAGLNFNGRNNHWWVSLFSHRYPIWIKYVGLKKIWPVECSIALWEFVLLGKIFYVMEGSSNSTAHDISASKPFYSIEFEVPWRVKKFQFNVMDLVNSDTSLYWHCHEACLQQTIYTSRYENQWTIIRFEPYIAKEEEAWGLWGWSVLLDCIRDSRN